MYNKYGVLDTEEGWSQMPKLEKDDGLSALEALRNALYKFKT